MMLVGGFLIACGGKKYKSTMFLAGLGASMAVILGGLFVFLIPFNTPEWTVWVGIIVSLLVGSVVGYGSARWPRFGVMLISASVGLLLGYFFYTAVVLELLTEHSKLTLWITMAATTLIFSILCIALVDMACIFGSAIAGSYLVVRGFGMIFGGYPSEFVIFEEMMNHRMNEM